VRDRDAERRLYKISAHQHGAFTRRQALAAGFSKRGIEGRIAAGDWLVLKRATYAAAGSPDTWERRATVELLVAGADAAVSHLAAAWLWKLIDERPDRIDVTVPIKRQVNGAHRARLGRGDTQAVLGFRVTSPGRTLIDLASTVDPAALEAVLDRSLLRGLVSVEGMLRYITTRGLARRRGVGVLRRLLEDRRGGVPESELEREFLRLVRRHKLPMPHRQERVGPYRVDFIYPNQRLVVEVDGRKDHSSKAAFEQDRRRQNELVLEGYRPLRFTWDAITKRAEEVARQLDRAVR
jgi:very-short-patch-repair endonuclease